MEKPQKKSKSRAVSSREIKFQRNKSPVAKSSKKKVSPRKSKDLPVSQGQFEEFRSEMNSKFTSVNLEFKAVRSEMAAMEKRIDARFAQIEARFAKIDERFAQMDAQFSKLDAKIELLIAAVHQTRMLVEEQNSRNRFVLDGFANLDARLEQHQKETEVRFNNIESVISTIRSEKGTR